MKETYIVLSRKGGLNWSVPSPSARALNIERTTNAGVEVHVEELDTREIKMLGRDRDTVAMAPAMPMRLIEPVQLESETALVAGMTTTWGVSAVGAGTSEYSGDGVTVAILDTGIDAGHTAFSGVELIRENFTDEDPSDLHGHGTHCAGTIFGRDVKGTRIGVAPGIKRALIGKVLGNKGGSSDRIAEAIQWAARNGAHIISMSLGMDFPGYAASLEEKGHMTRAAAISLSLEGYRKNVQLFEHLASMIAAFDHVPLLVAAAGNESGRDSRPPYEVFVAPPAVSSGFVSVAAVGQTVSNSYAVAPFSNTGADIAAPGVRVISAKRGTRDELVEMSGTSMATPHAVGVAALWTQKLLASGGPLNTEIVMAKLIASATNDRMVIGFDPTDTGAGVVIAPKN